MAKGEIILKKGFNQNGKKWHGVYVVQTFSSGKTFTTFVGFIFESVYKDLLKSGVKEYEID